MLSTFFTTLSLDISVQCSILDEQGTHWTPEIPFEDLTESERQLERKVGTKETVIRALTWVVQYTKIMSRPDVCTIPADVACLAVTG